MARPRRADIYRVAHFGGVETDSAAAWQGPRFMVPRQAALRERRPRPHVVDHSCAPGLRPSKLVSALSVHLTAARKIVRRRTLPFHVANL